MELGELGSGSWLLIGRRNASWEGSVRALVSFSTASGADYQAPIGQIPT